jgi:predicted transcriptional regulator of viral defense system
VNSIEFLNRLHTLKQPFIRTNEIAAVLGISVSLAGKYLEALRQQNFMAKIENGKWLVKSLPFDFLQIAEFITAPRESYISLHTALFYHGMIEQIPSQTYAVTVARTRVISTPLGVFSFHHCNPQFFKGYTYLKPMLKIACPEKALVDYFYFAPSKNRQFTHLPELELPKSFSWKKAFAFCEDIPSLRTKTLVLKLLEFLAKSSPL